MRAGERIEIVAQALVELGAAITRALSASPPVPAKRIAEDIRIYGLSSGGLFDAAGVRDLIERINKQVDGERQS